MNDTESLTVSDIGPQQAFPEWMRAVQARAEATLEATRRGLIGESAR